MGTTSKTILNNYCDSGHPCLFSYLSVFHHWKESLLWVCHIWPLLCWDRFLYAHFLESFYHKWVLDFVINFAVSFSFIISEINFKGRVHTVALKKTYPYNNRKSNKSFFKTLFSPPWWLLGGFPYLHCRQILHHLNHQGNPKREPSPHEWHYLSKSFRIYFLKPV